MDKVKSNVNKYLENGWDLRDLNSSLKDLIGAQVIIDVPESIKKQGKQAENNFLYFLYGSFLKYHGILENTTNNNHKYEFLPVNDKYHPNRLEKIIKRAESEGYDQGVLDNIYIPLFTPPFINPKIVNKVTRNYVRYPKISGYQGLHVYTIPNYPLETSLLSVPDEVIKPSEMRFPLEYHFYTREQYNYQSIGPASHKKYKSHEKVFHRLAIPIFIRRDYPEEVKEELSSDNSSNPLKLRNLADCIKDFYGVSIEDIVNISFKELRDNFSALDRDKILAMRVKPKKLPNNSWTTEKYKTPIFVKIDELSSVKDIIEKYINNRKKYIEKKAVKSKLKNQIRPYVIIKSAQPFVFKKPKVFNQAILGTEK